MIFHHDNMIVDWGNFELIIDNNTTEHVTEFKVLRFWLDNNLTFTLPCIQLRLSINSYKYLLYKKKLPCHPNILGIIYMVHIYSRKKLMFISMENFNKLGKTIRLKYCKKACIKTLTNSRIRQPILSMNKAINSVWFVEQVKLSLVYLCRTIKRSVAISYKNISTMSKQIKHKKSIYSHPEKVCYTVIQ